MAKVESVQSWEKSWLCRSILLAMASAKEKRENRLEVGICCKFLRLPRKEREGLRDPGIQGDRWVAGGNGYYLILLVYSLNQRVSLGPRQVKQAAWRSLREWEKEESTRLGGCKPMLRKELLCLRETDRAIVDHEVGPFPLPGSTGEGTGGAYSLRQGLWEKDSSNRSHSSCRLPLPLQVQLKATLALVLLTKLGVMVVPVG